MTKIEKSIITNAMGMTARAFVVLLIFASCANQCASNLQMICEKGRS